MYEEIYITATVDEVIHALSKIERTLVAKQKRWHHSKPLIICPRLSSNQVLRLVRLPDFIPDPNRENAFEFYVDYNSNKSHLAWTVAVRREGDNTCIAVALSDQLGDVQLFYRDFLKLLKAWAEQHPPTPDVAENNGSNNTTPAAIEPKGEEREAQALDAIVKAMATRQIDRSGDFLTRSYKLDDRIAIVILWNRWHKERTPTWTRTKHAQHFHIPEGTLSGWITNYGN